MYVTLKGPSGSKISTEVGEIFHLKNLKSHTHCFYFGGVIEDSYLTIARLTSDLLFILSKDGFSTTYVNLISELGFANFTFWLTAKITFI